VLIDAGQQRSRSSWWVSRLGEMHNDEGDSCCQTSCEPLESWKWIVLEVELKDGRDDDTRQSTEKVAEDEGPWLRQGYIDGSVAENGGGALSQGQSCSDEVQDSCTHERSHDGRYHSCRKVVRVRHYCDDDAKSTEGANEAVEAHHP